MKPDNIKLVEELVPRIRPMQDGETTPEYLNYISGVIDNSLFNTELGLIDMERSPVFKLWKIFSKPEPFNVDEVTQIFSWIKEVEKIQNSLKQRIGTNRKKCFYIIWKMYEEGKSYKEIYDVTHKISKYGNDPRDAIKNIKALVKNFGWKRKSK